MYWYFWVIVVALEAVAGIQRGPRESHRAWRIHAAWGSVRC
jgi:hypothetical protein